MLLLSQKFKCKPQHLRKNILFSVLTSNFLICWFKIILTSINDIMLLIVSIYFVFLLHIQRFKRIKRNNLETYLLTLNFAFVTEAITLLFWKFALKFKILISNLARVCCSTSHGNSEIKTNRPNLFYSGLNRRIWVLSLWLDGQFAPARVEFLLRVLLGIGVVPCVVPPYSGITLTLDIKSWSYEGGPKYYSTYLLRITMWFRISLKLCERHGKTYFIWFCLYGFLRITSLS